MHLHEVGLDGAIEDERVAQPRRGVAGWIAVLEFEAPEAGLDRFGVQPSMRVGGRWRRACGGVMPRLLSDNERKRSLLEPSAAAAAELYAFGTTGQQWAWRRIRTQGVKKAWQSSWMRQTP